MQNLIVEIFPQTQGCYCLRLMSADLALLDERPLDKGQLDALLRDNEGFYQSGHGNPAAIGQALFHWLDGEADGWLSRLQAGSRDNGTVLHITVDERLRHLHWELLLDHGNFLCCDANLPVLPVRRVRANENPALAAPSLGVVARPRQLSMLRRQLACFAGPPGSGKREPRLAAAKSPVARLVHGLISHRCAAGVGIRGGGGADSGGDRESRIGLGGRRKRQPGRASGMD